ncbi:hypothetical protein HZ326_28589 [Fusarium oxysporum f. sp. albedinis]|nr:hypothetical protein HZ326_28589 [Fusarium oxysporum f. sp. albedinis]
MVLPKGERKCIILLARDPIVVVLNVLLLNLGLSIPSPETLTGLYNIHLQPTTAINYGFACTDGQPRLNEHFIFYLKERRESVPYTLVQSADRLGSRMLPLCTAEKAFTLIRYGRDSKQIQSEASKISLAVITG